MMRVKVFLFLIAASFFSLSSNAQQVQQKIPEKTRILFLLDGSGSMMAKWKNKYRIDVAKRILGDLVDSLRVDSNLELALRVYGHIYERGDNNCEDTRLEVPFSSTNHDRIIQKLSEIRPKGTTPIAYSLQQAANDFPNNQGYRNIIVIITDGIESCDGDPCAVSRALQRKGIFLKPFVIGIGGMREEYDRQLSCIGKYYNAADETVFQKALNEAIETTMATTTATVALQNNQGQNVYTNINVTFQNEITRTAAYDFIHYLDSRKRPDTVQIDPVLSYNIIVNTLPEKIKRSVSVIPGKHNHIEIKIPQGYLNVNLRNSKSYSDKVKVLMHKRNGELFFIQDIDSRTLYLEGTYEAVVTTLPRKKVTVNIEEGAPTTINLPAPGIVNFSTTNVGYGSIYEMQRDGSQTWVTDLSIERPLGAVTLQPGNYKVVYRSKNALGSKYTIIKEFTIESGASTRVNLL